MIYERFRSVFGSFDLGYNIAQIAQVVNDRLTKPEFYNQCTTHKAAYPQLAP